MKNSNYIINGVLLVAIIVLFILQFTGRRANMKNSESDGAVADSTDYRLPMAYIRTDSLFPNYKFFVDLSEANLKKIEDKKLDINRRSEKFKKDVLEYQQKSQMNAFLTQERELQEQKRLAGVQQDLENYIARAEREMALEGENITRQLQDTIISALKLFNTPKKYHFILSNAGTDNILYADDVYDITKEVIEFLNARYVPSKSK